MTSMHLLQGTQWTSALRGVADMRAKPGAGVHHMLYRLSRRNVIAQNGLREASVWLQLRNYEWAPEVEMPNLQSAIVTCFFHCHAVEKNHDCHVVGSAQHESETEVRVCNTSCYRLSFRNRAL